MFIALDHYDEWLVDNQRETLLQALKGLQCENVEWNGHFGAHIFFALDAENDTDERREQIGRLINTYMNRAARWLVRTHKGEK